METVRGEMVCIPKEAAADLVASQVNQLWSQWANDEEVPGCCPRHCAACHALKQLMDLGWLDVLYGAHLEAEGGESSAWDAEGHQVGRAWLLEAWSVDRGCCSDE